MSYISSCLNEFFYNFGMISFDCNIEGSVSFGRHVIHVSFHAQQ